MIHVLEQACGSLAEAQRKGLIRRDVKPANIMLCERGGLHDVVKVLDFGLVKEAGEDDPRGYAAQCSRRHAPVHGPGDRQRAWSGQCRAQLIQKLQAFVKLEIVDTVTDRLTLAAQIPFAELRYERAVARHCRRALWQGHGDDPKG